MAILGGASRSSRWMRWALLALVYFALARSSLWLAIPGSNASPVWPPSGLAFSVLLLLGVDLWPAITLGALAANLAAFASPQGIRPQLLAASAAIAVGNTLEGVIATLLTRRFAEHRVLTFHVADVFRFLAIALLSCAISAAVGVGSLVLASAIPAAMAPTVALTWWLGDLCGMLTIVPLALGWAAWKNGSRVHHVSTGELALTTVATLLFSILVFANPSREASQWRPLILLVLPWVALVAKRDGLRGSATAILAANAAAVAATIGGRGLLEPGPINSVLIQLDIIVVLFSLIAMLLAADRAERIDKLGAVPRWGDLALPWGALFAGCALTVLSWHMLALSDEAQARARFRTQVDEIVQRLSDRIADTQRLLQGAAGLFLERASVSRSLWHDYVESLHLASGLPGIQGVGFAEAVAPQDVARLTQRVRDEGFADYTVHPGGQRSLYVSVVFIEPFDAVNRRAFGYDMYSEPLRRAAMQAARDSGAPAASAKVRLLQEGQGREEQHGFLLYVPVYRRPGGVHTVEQRRAQLRGFTYSPFRMNDLIEASVKAAMQDVNLEVFDGRGTAEAALLYPYAHDRLAADGAQIGALSLVQDIDVGHHDWTVRVTSRSAYWNGIDQGKSKMVLIFGMLLSAVLFALIRTLSLARHEAQQLARRMAQAFQAAESSLSSLADTTQDAIVMADSQGTITELNPAAVLQFGAVQGRLSDLVTLADRPAVDDALAEMTEHDSARHVRLKVNGRRSQDHLVPMELSLSSWHTEQGRRFGAIFTDISQRHRADEFMRTVFDEGPDAMLIINGDGHIERANERAAQVFKMPLARLQGTLVEALLPSSRREAHRQERQRFNEHPTRRAMADASDLVAQRDGGEVFPVNISLNVMRVADGKKVIATIVDVSERRAMEKQIQELLALQQAILQGASVSIIATRPDGIIISFNTAAERMLGYSAQEMIERQTPAVIHVPDEIVQRARELSLELGRAVEPGFEVFVARARQGIADEREWTYVRKDGSRFPVLLVVTGLFDPQHRLTGFLGIATDISARKAHEQALNDALNEKKTLLREVYHRVKNNLQVVGSLFNLQLRGLPAGPARQALSDGASRVQSMALVHEKLYQSQSLASLNLQEYATDLCHQLMQLSSLGSEALNLQLDIEPIVIGLERAVPLGLLINELFTNSVKHGLSSQGRGTVRVRLRRESEDVGVLEVSDDGPGFPPLDEDLMAQSLGLRLAQTLTRQLDGEIVRDNRPGAYTRIRFHLSTPSFADTQP